MLKKQRKGETPGCFPFYLGSVFSNTYNIRFV
jgi:hypothetical protein